MACWKAEQACADRVALSELDRDFDEAGVSPDGPIELAVVAAVTGGESITERELCEMTKDGGHGMRETVSGCM